MTKSNKIKIKEGYILKPNTNRQIKILGKAHREVIAKMPIGHYGRENEIKKWELRRDLKEGDLKAVSGLVNLRYRFKSSEIKQLEKKLKEEKYVAEITTNTGKVKWVTLTNKGLMYLTDVLERGYEEVDLVEYGSDSLMEIAVDGIKKLNIKKLDTPKKIFKNKNGKLFKYINKTNINLERYQILNEESNNEIVKENCLIYALERLGVDESDLNAVKLSHEIGSYIAVKDLKEISNIIKYTIVLHKFANTERKIKKSKIGDYKRSVDIAIYENHYFIYEDVNYTRYCLKNYNDVNHLKNYNKITGKSRGKYEYRKVVKKCDSLNMIRYLHENNNFDSKHIKLTELEGIGKIVNVLNIPLKDINNEQEEYIHEEQETKKYTIFYADTESIVTEGEHKCILTGIVKTGDRKVKITQYDEENPKKHFDDMLNYVDLFTSKDSIPIIYFHNLKYDYSVLKKYLYIIDSCEKDGSYYSIKILFNKRVMLLKDSYKLFNEPLRNFGSAFCLPEKICKKEAIGYTFYNSKNIKLERHSVKEYMTHLKKKERDLFINILKSNSKFDYDGKTFKAMEYYKYYLKYDCLVLMKGFEVFEKKIKDITGFNIHDSLTISSLSNKYFASEGSFDGLYKVKGNLRDYLSRAIIGGRCALLESEKKKKITKQLVDYDACSLYPSAIYRLCLEMGLPKGKAKRITKNCKKYLDEKDYYTVTVRINKINKKQQIPFISIKDNEGILQYVNEVPEGGYVCVIDKITLEDYIEFHDIEYEILDGVYWNNGFNKTFGVKVEYLYNKRLLEKAKAKNMKLTESERKSGEIMQNIIKLMLNSAYGKTIIKKSKVKKVIMNKGEKLDNYIYNNFHTIKEIIEISDKQKLIKLDAIDDTYNLAHVGVLVLSYSKRIMNEVMNTANDNNIKVYYQDTDSMHIERSRIAELEEIYEKKYNRKLNGKNMCNFHSDFNLKGSDSDIYSIESYFLGKKCYLDKLECINKDGTIINGYHLRLKGVTKAGIEHVLEKKFKSDKSEMFKYLSESKPLEIILNPSESVSMQFTNTGVFNREEDEFKRTLKF